MNEPQESPEPQEQGASMGVEVTCHSAIFSIVGEELTLLVRERNEGPFRFHWELPGVNPTHSEDLAFTALRAVAPPLPLSPVLHMQQLGAYGAPNRDPRHQSVAVVYWGVTRHGDIQTTSSNLHPIPIGSWASEEFRFAFDHQLIATDALTALRQAMNNTSAATQLCEAHFTMSELQHVYEIIFDKKISAGNFHRKISNTPGFIIPTDQQIQEPNKKGRPAQHFESTEIVAISPPFQFQATPPE